jgi:transposase
VSTEDCRAIVSLVQTAVSDGCRQEEACKVVGITAKTYQRWVSKAELGDQRRGPNTAPANKFTSEEKAKIIAISTETAFMNLSPH